MGAALTDPELLRAIGEALAGGGDFPYRLGRLMGVSGEYVHQMLNKRRPVSRQTWDRLERLLWARSVEFAQLREDVIRRQHGATA